MKYVFAIVVFQWVSSTFTAGILPENWKEFIDPETLAKFDDTQSHYDGDKFEGDITSFESEDMPANVAANAVDNANLMWSNNTVPYEFTTQRSIRFRRAERAMVIQAMEIIMVLTEQCVKFVERTTETDYIKFQKGPLCFSDVGHTGGRQIVSLSSACLEHYGSIQHELLHVLGFLHEQSRLDRDDYVTINWDNIAEGFWEIQLAVHSIAHVQVIQFMYPSRIENKRHFSQHASQTYGLPYDYESVMHYEVKAFAVDDQLPTIIPKVWRAKLGQKVNLSPLDVARIHKRFKCGVPSGKDFVKPPPSDNLPMQQRGPPEFLSPDPFPYFSTEPMMREQCALQFTPHCGRTGYTARNCTSTQTLEINCNNRATSRHLQDIAAEMSKDPLRAIGIRLSGGEQLDFASFDKIRTQVVVLSVEDCRSVRVTANLPRSRYSNLLSFALLNCHDMNIIRSDFAQSIKLRAITLWNTTIQSLEKETFADLPALKLLSLEWGFNQMNIFSKRIRTYLKRLHCGCEFFWFRRWWSANLQLLRKAEESEVYMVPNSWSNSAWNKNEIYLPIDCSATPFPAGPASIDFTQEKFSIFDDETKYGNGSSNCNRGGSEVEPFPAFSEEPMTSEHCGLQFTVNCAPHIMTRTNCTATLRLDVSCNGHAGAEEFRTIATGLAKMSSRPTRLDLDDRGDVSFANFAPIRKQIVAFAMRHCRDDRATGKLNELRIINLLDHQLFHCYGLFIKKRDFKQTPKLRVFVLINSTALTLEVDAFADLPALRILGLEYGLRERVLFAQETGDYLYRLHCSCEFAWYRRWWSNNTALLRQAEVGEIYSFTGAWISKPYTTKDLYLPVNCAALPLGCSSLNFSQMEFSVNEKDCRS